MPSMKVPLIDLTPLYLSQEIRHIESLHAKAPLMARAGLAAAHQARELMHERRGPILVLAGPGNNGGDAFVAARYLQEWFFDVYVLFTGNVEKLPPDAAKAFHRWQQHSPRSLLTQWHAEKQWALIIDGLFGLGLRSEPKDPYRSLIERVNAQGAPVLALDLPSGLDADTGRVYGRCIRATHTLTFIAAKPGLFTQDGPDHCGQISLEDLEVPRLTSHNVCGQILTYPTQGLAPRPKNSHKGSFGSVGIIGGAPGMLGAALLSARAAIKMGAGRVYVGLLDPQAPGVDFIQPELMMSPASTLLSLSHLNVMAIGPGLGTSAAAHELLASVIDQMRPLIIDADGLNLIAADATLQKKIKARSAPTLLTPHPGEAARLLQCSTLDIQHNRLHAVTRLAQQLNAEVLLKGAGSLCASADGQWRLNLTGNPAMASSGMGDVLTGMISALLAQTQSARHALALAVCLHGAAADQLVAESIGPIGLTASETIDRSRQLLNQLTFLPPTLS